MKLISSSYMDSSGLSVDDQMLEIPNLALTPSKSNKEVVDDSSDSCIRTLEPFSTSSKVNVENQSKSKSSNDPKQENESEGIVYQRNRRRKYKLNPTLVHFDSLFGTDNWPRYLIFKTESDISAAKLENILLTTYPSREMAFRPINRREWLVEASTKEQSEIYQNLNNINGIEVSVQRHDKLNSIEGTVVLPQNNDCDGLPDENVLLESLKIRYPNVEHVKVYEIPNKKFPSKKLRIARIKFEGQVLPSNIKIEGQKRELLPYVPKPLQCNNCSKFGHTYVRCRNASKCAFCGSTDHTTTWNCSSPKCCNCGQNHHARSKVCPFYLYNTELKLLISRSGMSVFEAKQELKSRGLIDPAKNLIYRNAVKGIISTETVKIYEKNKINKLSETPKPVNEKSSNNNNEDTVATSNFYEILSQDVEEHLLSEQELDETHLDFKGQKRSREQVSPKTKKPDVNKKRILNLKRQTSRESQVDDINPSPIFPSKFKKKSNSREIQSSNCECKECIQNGNVSKIATHHEHCGCHSCFLEYCNESRPLTKDKLRNIIRNFILRKDNTTSDFQSHSKDCMCIVHLLHYRENRISILDNFLDKHKTENQTKTPAKQSIEKSNNTELSEKSKLTSSVD